MLFIITKINYPFAIPVQSSKPSGGFRYRGFSWLNKASQVSYIMLETVSLPSLQCWATLWWLAPSAKWWRVTASFKSGWIALLITVSCLVSLGLIKVRISAKFSLVILRYCLWRSAKSGFLSSWTRLLNIPFVARSLLIGWTQNFRLGALFSRCFWIISNFANSNNLLLRLMFANRKL